MFCFASCFPISSDALVDDDVQGEHTWSWFKNLSTCVLFLLHVVGAACTCFVLFFLGGSVVSVDCIRLCMCLFECYVQVDVVHRHHIDIHHNTHNTRCVLSDIVPVSLNSTCSK